MVTVAAAIAVPRQSREDGFGETATA